MKKPQFMLFGVIFCVLIAACGSNDNSTLNTPADDKESAEPDSMIYGLSCDGTNDSVVVFLPFSNYSDPKTYNIEEAKARGCVIGKPSIGDWIGIIVNPKDSTEALMAINLDKLKGTWTYEVRPTWKDASKLTARAIRKNFDSMPDSLREAYLVPREYGFTLSRSNQASPVGMLRTRTSLEDDSPVEYPPVKHYRKWKTLNGHLILTSVDMSDTPSMTKEKTINYDDLPQHHDTLDFVFMTDDSLVVMTQDKQRIAFHRKANAKAANAKALEAAQKVEKKDIK